MNMPKPPAIILIRPEDIQTPGECSAYWAEVLKISILEEDMVLRDITFRLKVYKEKIRFWEKAYNRVFRKTPTSVIPFTTSEVLVPERREDNTWTFNFWIHSRDQDKLLRMDPYPIGKWGIVTESNCAVLEIEPQDILCMSFDAKEVA